MQFFLFDVFKEIEDGCGAAVITVLASGCDNASTAIVTAITVLAGECDNGH